MMAKSIMYDEKVTYKLLVKLNKTGFDAAKSACNIVIKPYGPLKSLEKLINLSIAP